jgi:probable F420-dependent oxidoreductase
MTAMHIGFSLPQFGTIASEPGAVVRFAREAEALGAGSLWAGDRLLSPVRPEIGYRGTDTMPEPFRACLDPFAVLTAAAAATERATLGTSVLNAPFYAPALLARSLTSIDVISGGRLIPGFGAGWSPDELRAVGVPKAERGERLDECLDILQTLWTSNPAEHHGKHWDIAATYADLKPVQRPRPPVYLGGFSPAALRRVARRGDGWLPAAVVPGGFDPAALAGTLGRIREEAERAGRDPQRIDAILRINPTSRATPADVTEAIDAARQEAGIKDVFAEIMYVAGTVAEAIDFAGAVLAKAWR